MKLNKIFLSMAALVFVGAMTAGCSGDDLTAETPQFPDTAGGTLVTKVTVSLDEHASTRMLDPSGMMTFEEGDKIAVIYKNTAGVTVKAESDPLQATDLHDAKKTASFSVTLTNPKAHTPVRYIYPASMAADDVSTTTPDNDATIKWSNLASQSGSFPFISEHVDLAVFDGTMTAQAVLPAATLENPLTICGFTLQDSGNSNADITNTVNSLTVNDGTNSYAVTPTSALSTIYVAMKPTSGNIAFAASTTAPKTYFKTATGKTLKASNLYSISVSMQSVALGNVFCSDGSIYSSKDAATTAGKTPIAMICYLGNDAETNATYRHGLALALTDANSGNEAGWCSQKSATCLGSGSQYGSETAAKGDMAGIDNTDALIAHGTHTHDAAKAARNYNSGTHPAGTSAWFLPSAGQWDKMITAAGGFVNLKTNAGLQSVRYWPSTEIDSYCAWRYNFGDGNWHTGHKDTDHYVRACLAF